MVWNPEHAYLKKAGIHICLRKVIVHRTICKYCFSWGFYGFLSFVLNWFRDSHLMIYMYIYTHYLGRRPVYRTNLMHLEKLETGFFFSDFFLIFFFNSFLFYPHTVQTLKMSSSLLCVYIHKYMLACPLVGIIMWGVTVFVVNTGDVVSRGSFYAKSTNKHKVAQSWKFFNSYA